MSTTHSGHPLVFGLVASVAMSALACSHEEQTPAPSAPVAATPIAPGPSDAPQAAAPLATTAPPVATASAQPMLTNEQILAVTHTANVGEIQQARLAQSKSKDERVQELAAMMLRDHSDAEAKGKALAQRDSLTDRSSPTSEALKADADGATRTLKTETGPGFDKDYVDTQCREHQAVLDMIDQKLMPGATIPDVKSYLGDVRATVAMHLEHARKLQQEMSKQALR